MHNLYLIVGRTASGKDTLSRYVAKKHNLKILCSYTTRPKRPGETDEHIFISANEVEKYKNDMVAYTKIGDYEYFCTKQQLMKNDIYIIDPNGVEFLKEKIKDVNNIELHIIYIALDYITRKSRALNSRKDPVEVFEKRCEAEEDQFVDFECNRVYHKRIDNSNLDKAVKELEQYILFNNKMEDI